MLDMNRKTLPVMKVCIFALVLFLHIANAAWASAVNIQNILNAIPEHKKSSLQDTVDERVAMYNSLYPDVLFVQLAGGDEMLESMEVLQIFLGHEAENLDYEHPPEAREDLLYVTLESIIMMLEHKASSAALFRVGMNSLAERDYLCVLTLTPEEVARDDVMATQDLMLDLSAQEFEQVDPDNYLDHIDYVKFNIDHEVHHCLDSLFNGPRPMSKDKFWGEYMAYHHNQAADTFALGMNIREHAGRTDFSRIIGQLRALSILYGDPNHYTFPIIQKLLGIDREIIMSASEQQLFRLSSDLRDKVVADYDKYLRFVASAREVMVRLRKKPEIHPDVGSVEYDEELVQELLLIVQRSYMNIIGNKPGG